mgnify:CR=1 FL=1
MRPVCADVTVCPVGVLAATNTFWPSLSRVLVDEKHPLAVGGLLKLARRDPLEVTALLEAVFQLLDLLIGPGPYPHGHAQHQDQDGPRKLQHGAQKAQQTATAAEPDDHLAVAEHARERPDHGHEQAHGEQRRQVTQHGVTQHQPHLGRIHVALRGHAQGADQHHGHHDGEQHQHGGRQTTGQLLTQGGME